MRRRLALLPFALALAAAVAWLVIPADGLGILRGIHLELSRLRSEHPWLLGAGYFLAYAATTALSFPWAALLTVLAGAIFGFWPGVLLVSGASTLGATGAFWLSRTLLRERVLAKFGGRLRAIRTGFERDGAYYLFTLRLIPAVPFFLVNLLMGLTPIRAREFFGVTLIGTLPVIGIYVNAGTRLAELRSTGDLLSPGLLLSLALVGALPLLARRASRAPALARVKHGLDRAARR